MDSIMNKRTSISIFSNEALELLRKAIIKEATQLNSGNSLNSSRVSTTRATSSTTIEQQQVVGIRGKSYHQDSDFSEEEAEESIYETDEEKDESRPSSAAPNAPTSTTSSFNIAIDGSDKRLNQVSSNNHKKKRTKQEIIRQMGNPPLTTILLDDISQNDSSLVVVLSVPSVLLSFHSMQTNQELDETTTYTPTSSINTSTSPLQHLISLSTSLQDKYIFTLTLQSGRFAAAIFHQMKCIVHTTSTRYTTRKGQGGSQSSNDNAKGKAKSIGSQLRRAGEDQLRKDVFACLKEWYNAGYIAKCAFVFLSISKSLQKGFWEDVNKLKTSDKVHSRGGHDASNIFYKKSNHVVNIPLDVGRPSYEGCCAIHELLTTLHIDTMSMDSLKIQSAQDEDMIDSMKKETEEHQERIKLDTIVEQDDGSKNDKSLSIVPFTVIHSAVQDGNVEQLDSLLSMEEYVDYVDLRAGPDLMTPLHIAAASSHPSSIKCIRSLLVEGHANPGILDGRNRPPYFLATTEGARNAFRTIRAKIPDAWDWDACKVGPALTGDDLKRKKEKAAEKKKRQREKQKERKAAEAAEMQEAKRKEDDKLKQEDEKRKRAGLQPKVSSKPGEYTCDFCQKGCKRKSEMFQRLDFYYCSTDCVKRHQRELMAAAATTRLGK